MWHKLIFVSENIWIDICHTLDQSSNISLLPRLWPQLDKVTEDSDLVLNVLTGTLLLVRPHNFSMGEQVLGGEFGLVLRLHHQLTAYDDWEKQCGKKKTCFHISAQVWLLSPQRSPTKQVNLSLLPKLIVTLQWKWKAVGFCWFSHFLTSPHYGPQYGAQLCLQKRRVGHHPLQLSTVILTESSTGTDQITYQMNKNNLFLAVSSILWVTFSLARHTSQHHTT